MSVAIFALGLVMIAEGLVYALAPSLVEDLLEALRRLTIENRRLMGLVALGGGVLLVWLSGALPALT